jgi:hypothetical protein
MMTPPPKIGRPMVVCIVSLVVALCVLRPWRGNEPAAAAQPARSADAVRTDLRPKVEELLALYSQGKIDDLLQRMPVPPADTRDEFENLRRELIGLTGIAGRYLGFDIVASETLSDRYHEVYVLAYFEKEPILFEFGFYRPADAWQVQRFKVKTDLGPFLDVLLTRKP